MALAFKVAGNRSYHSGNPTYGGQSAPQRYYQVSGVWPRYEVMVLGHDETRQILWGKRSLKAHLVSLRMQGFINHTEYWK